MHNKAIILVSTSLMLVAPGVSSAVSLMSAPTFTPATNASLAGLLRLTTDVNTRVSVSVSNSLGSWTRNFHDFQQTHSIQLAGFKPGRSNQIFVTVYDERQNSQSMTEPLIFNTPALPADFPHSRVLHADPTNMEAGYTLFTIQNRTTKSAYVTMMDSAGDVVWYMPAPAPGDVDVRQLSNGNIFIEEQKPLNRFLEINLLGEVVNSWSAPSAYPVNNHDGVPTDHGTILYLSDVSRMVSNFPSSSTIPQAPLITTNVDDNPIVEISVTNGQLMHAWSPLDVLAPTRVTYLTYQFPSAFGVDNEHANAVIEDPSDNSIIVSLRTQNAVFKFLRSTGQLKWILGPHENWPPAFQPYLLTPVGTPFEWNYGQHAPQLTPNHTLLLYDDGNDRASPFEQRALDQTNYSRAVEYKINETTMEVSQVWDSTPAKDDRLYTGAVGDADWLPHSGNILITYGLVSYVNGAHPSLAATNATMARIIEMTHEAVPKVVFDLSFFDPTNSQPTYLGYLCYRSDRIPDLYAHPMTPVQDLKVSFSVAGPRLQFSGDPNWSYTLEASTNQLQWQSLGTAMPGAVPDTYEFLDSSADLSTARFYRVVCR